MALFLNTNVKALNAKRNLAGHANALDSSAKRLASGLRINSARDDAAGLQISDRLTSQINGLNQGNRNAQDGISFCQTAEGALEEMTNMYQRIRTLAIQSANGANSAADRMAIQEEVSELCKEITRIGEDTTYGGMHILNKTLTEPTAFQAGADAGETISVDLTSGFRLDDVFLKIYNDSAGADRDLLMSGGVTRKIDCGQSGNPPAFDVSADFFAPPGEYDIKVNSIADYTQAAKPYALFDKTIEDEEGNIVTIPWNERTFGAGTITVTGGSGSNAKSFAVAVEEGDTIDSIFRKIYRAENFNFVRTSGHWDINSHDKLMFLWNTARGEANRALSVSTTGDSDLKLFEFSISADEDTLYKTCGDGWKTKHLAWDTVIEIDGEAFATAGYSVYDDEKRLNITANYPCGSIKVTIAPETVFAVDTEAAAQSAIAIADKFIAAIDSKRAELGAAQNRLESAIRNQSNVAENLETARSRIRDTDYAAETAALARENILQEASRSILVNANHSSEMILSLLQK